MRLTGKMSSASLSLQLTRMLPPLVTVDHLALLLDALLSFGLWDSPLS